MDSPCSCISDDVNARALNFQDGWDEPVNSDCLRLWQSWDSQLTHVNQIKIPRWNNYAPRAIVVEVHGFADALKSAYGASVYLRIKQGSQVTVTLQLAKSKSAPIKWAGIPRLE